MKKDLHKEILKRSWLRNTFLEDKTETNRENRKTPRSFGKKT